VITHDPAGGDPTVDLASLDRIDLELDHPITDPDLVTYSHLTQQLWMSDRGSAGIPFDRFTREDKARAGFKQDAPLLKSAETELRALQILENRDGLPPPRLTLPDATDDFGVVGMSAVGKVQPRDIHPGMNKTVQDLRRRAGWTNRADDFGSAHKRDVSFQRSADKLRLLKRERTIVGVPLVAEQEKSGQHPMKELAGSRTWRTAWRSLPACRWQSPSRPRRRPRGREI
jgi:hypothetical protein